LGADASENLITISARKKKEVQRLRKIFKNLDVNRRKLADKLIERAATMLIYLEDMEAQIEADREKSGSLTIQMQQGDYTISRAHPLLEKHISMGKNYAAFMKQLEGMLPPGETQTEAAKEARAFLMGNKP